MVKRCWQKVSYSHLMSFIAKEFINEDKNNVQDNHEAEVNWD